MYIYRYRYLRTYRSNLSLQKKTESIFQKLLCWMHGGCIGSFMVGNVLWSFVELCCLSAVYLFGFSLFSGPEWLYRYCFRLEHIVVDIVVIVVNIVD